MRVQIAPQCKSNQSSIIGYRISPQHGNTISSKPYAATRINYQNILDDGKEISEPSTTNLLPINFCHTPGEYNKLLITNGRKITMHSDTQEVSIPTVEFLNNDVHKRNQQKQEKIKQIYKIKEEQRQKSTTVELAECNCCCCDTYCQICSDEMHFNFDHQKVLSGVPKMNERVKSERSLRSPVRRVIPIEKEEWINRSELSRSEKAKKRKFSVAYSLEEPESYLRIKPMLQQSVEKQKEIQYYNSTNDPKFVAQNKIDRIKDFDDRRKVLASVSLSSKQFKPEHPWNYHLPKEPIKVDPYCHSHHGAEVKPFVPMKKKVVEQELNIPCHPSSHLSPDKIEIIRKKKGQMAYQVLKNKRQQKIQQKIQLTQKLRKLEQERRNIIRNTPKQKFKPSSAQIDFAFAPSV